MIRILRRFATGLSILAGLLTMPGVASAVDLTAGAWRRVDTDFQLDVGMAATLRESARQLVLMNDSTSVYWTLDVDTPGEWTRVVVPGPNPGFRQYAPMIYDSLRDRWILIRLGSGRTTLTGPIEVWALRLSGTPAWTLIHNATGPSGRNEAYVAYDARADRVLVYGGGFCVSGYGQEYNCGPYLPRDQIFTELWALPLAGPGPWVQLPLSGPPAEAWPGGMLIDDRARGRLLLAAPGKAYPQATHADINRVWSLNLASPTAWQEAASFNCGYFIEYQYAAFVDSVGGRILTHGGREDAVHSPWVQPFLRSRDFPTGSCTAIPGSEELPPRYGHLAIPDPPRNRVILVGGKRRSTEDFKTRETWSVELGPPFRVEPMGILRDCPVTVVGGETVVFDPVGERAVLWGGHRRFECGSPYGCPYVYPEVSWSASLREPRLEDWRRIEVPSAAHARASHSNVPDRRRNRSLAFGGYHNWSGNRPERAFDDVVAFDFATSQYAVLPTNGTGPIGRYGHAAVVDPIRDRMLILYGRLQDDYTPLPEVTDAWSLSLDTATWSQLAIDPSAPRPGPDLQAVYDPTADRVLATEPSGPGAIPALWSLSLGPAPAWTRIPMAEAVPGPGSNARIVWDPVRDRMLCFEAGTVTFNPLQQQVRSWALDLTPPARWFQLAYTAPAHFPLNAQPPIVYDAVRDRFVVPYSDMEAAVWALEFGTPEWPVRLSRRWSHVVRAITPDEPEVLRLLIHGGSPPDSPIHPRPLDLSRLVPASMQWTGVVPLLDGGGSPIIEVGDVDGDGVADWTVDVVRSPTPPADGLIRLAASNVDGARLLGELPATTRIPVGVRLHDEDAPVFEVRSIHGAGGTTRVRLTTNSEDPAQAELYDVRGRRVAIRSLAPRAQEPLEFGWQGESRLAPGVYLVRVRQGTNTATVRIVAL